MSRHTSLYQTPRSPLIQGRTRWERPLWQPWIAGVIVALVVPLLVLLIVSPAELRALSFVYPWLTLAVVVGAGIGTLLGRWWGIRHRWISAALAGLLVAAAVLGYLIWLQARINY